MIEQIKPDIDKSVLIYTRKEICAKCNGFCCKTAAGIYLPEDFKVPITTAFVLHLLMTKMFTIDSVGDGDDVTYFIRPRHIEEDPIFPEIYGGICINFKSEVGCLLSEEERPFQCRTLIPLADGVYCKHKDSDKARKADIVPRWSECQNEISLARSIYKKLSNTISYVYEFDSEGRYPDVYKNLNEIISQIESIIGKI